MANLRLRNAPWAGRVIIPFLSLHDGVIIQMFFSDFFFLKLSAGKEYISCDL